MSIDENAAPMVVPATMAMNMAGLRKSNPPPEPIRTGNARWLVIAKAFMVDRESLVERKNFCALVVPASNNTMPHSTINAAAVNAIL